MMIPGTGTLEVPAGTGAASTSNQNSFEIQVLKRWNCYNWLKKYTVIEVVARENGGCARQKGSFDGHNLQNGGHNLGHNHKSLYLYPRL